MGSGLPNEATTAFLTAKELETQRSIRTFYDGLDVTQKSRFEEIAHHFVYLGFTEGINRQPITELTPELQARVLVKETEMYSWGVADAIDKYGLT